MARHRAQTPLAEAGHLGAEAAPEAAPGLVTSRDRGRGQTGDTFIMCGVHHPLNLVQGFSLLLCVDSPVLLAGTAVFLPYRSVSLSSWTSES